MRGTRLVIVTWLWKNKNKHRVQAADFGVKHVNTLAGMLDRNIKQDFRFVCITDDPDNPAFECETFPLWDDHTELVSHPQSETYVSCYPRLKIFSPEIGKALEADVILSLDLDTVITGEFDSVLDSYEPPFTGLRVKENSRPLTYNGSMFMFDVGNPTVVKLWDEFDITTSPEQASLFGYRGSDQAWISFRLGNNYKWWGTDDGVYSYRKHVRQLHDLPSGCRIVHFFGRHNPWHADAASARWIERYYK